LSFRPEASPCGSKLDSYFPLLALSPDLTMALDSSLLVECLCSAFVQSDQGARLQQAATDFKDWSAFVAEATHHRLLPLAYWTFKRHQIETPRQVKRIMAGAYLRQKSLAQAQTAAMLETLRALSERGIEALVLKGGALAHLVYPEPGLRPMEDIDILVAPDCIAPAREVLLSLGYIAPPESSRFDRLYHHLPMAHRQDSGHTVCIELHRELFVRILNCRLNFSHLARPFPQFEIEGRKVAHLGHESLLWMQYRGLRKLAEPLRKLQLVDIALMAERLPDEWHGPSLRVRHLELWHALVALDRYMPLSNRTRQFLGVPPRQIADPSEAPGRDYAGWPRQLGPRKLADWGQTLWPTRWWAEFFYGLAPKSNRWQIQRSHWGLFFDQGWRRLELGPVAPNLFFSPKPTAYPVVAIPVSENHDSEKAQEADAAVPHVQPEQVQAKTQLETDATASIPSSTGSARIPTQVQTDSTVLVTCIYNGLSGTRYGGRLNRDDYYRKSLATIARSSGLPILCFLPAAGIPIEQSFFEGRPHRIRWIPQELTDIPHTNEIQRIKSDHLEDYSTYVWQERCLELMWGKFHMLRQALERYPTAEHLFWIDAGLANVNIISTKYTDAEALQAGDMHRVDSAFVPDLFLRMQDMAGDRLLAIKSTVPHNRGIPEKYNDRPYENADGLTGGLFGGKRNVVNTVCQLFEVKVQKLLADDVLYLEESVMTGLFADHPELFETYTFDSWYHEGWNSHNPNVMNFSQFFDLMLHTPTPSHPLKFPWNQ
jgi:Uncharacterised nucleotidyltransferase